MSVNSILKNRAIIILAPNCLVGVGLKTILRDYYACGSIILAKTYDDYYLETGHKSPDIIFLPPEIYITHIDHFQAIRKKVVVLIENDVYEPAKQSSPAYIDLKVTESEIVDRLSELFHSRFKVNRLEKAEGLSARENEVLNLVALGQMSKEIADRLHISLNTVLTHRKNISRKLGINSVSGLTVYALLNGIISSDELEISPVNPDLKF